MNNRTTLGQIGVFLAYVLFQVFFANKLVLFDTAFCFVYISFLLGLPYDMSKVYLLLTGFITGLTIDIFSDTLGIHTAGCLLITYIRPYLIGLLAARSNVNTDMINEISIRELNLSWYLTYAIVMILTHHITIFLIEAGSMTLLGLTLQKTIFSTIFTLIAVILIQYFFFTPRRR